MRTSNKKSSKTIPLGRRNDNHISIFFLPKTTKFFLVSGPSIMQYNTFSKKLRNQRPNDCYQGKYYYKTSVYCVKLDFGYCY